MSADNVTPIRHCPREEVSELLDELHDDVIQSIPSDDLEPGYRLSVPSVRNLLRAIPLLREALTILEEVRDHEDPIYNALYERRHPEEAAS